MCIERLAEVYPVFDRTGWKICDSSILSDRRYRPGTCRIKSDSSVRFQYFKAKKNRRKPAADEEVQKVISFWLSWPERPSSQEQPSWPELSWPEQLSSREQPSWPELSWPERLSLRAQPSWRGLSWPGLSWPGLSSRVPRLSWPGRLSSRVFWFSSSFYHFLLLVKLLLLTQRDFGSRPSLQSCFNTTASSERNIFSSADFPTLSIHQVCCS